MSNFREAQRQAHPTKTNTLLLGVMCVLILILIMQVWLLTAALNESLDGHNAVRWPAFGVSLFLFGSGAALLRYLPSPIRLPAREMVREAFPHAALAWRTLGVSAASLALAFAVWSMWSAIPLRLKEAGFTFSRQQLFWLTATPVLLGSFLRIPYGLIVSTFGSRRSYAIVTLFKIIPLVLTKEAGAAIGIVSCLGALGGFVPPLLLGWTMDHLGSPAWAYTGMALFALTCLFVNVWFYHRRTSPSHC